MSTMVKGETKMTKKRCNYIDSELYQLELRLAKADKVNSTQKCEINLLWDIINTLVRKERERK